MTNCHSCGAKMIWAENLATGKKIPLDANTGAEGRTRYRLVGDRSIGACEKVTEQTDEPTYVSHFETCPNAQSHSRKVSK